MIGRTIVWVASATAVLAGCGTTDADPSVEVTVHGTVSIEGGGQLAAVVVQATAFRGACDGYRFASEGDSGLTGAQYEIRLVGPGAPFDGCVLVEVFDDHSATDPVAVRTVEDVSFDGFAEEIKVRIDMVIPRGGE